MNFDETLFDVLFSAAHRSNLIDGLILVFAEYVGYIIALVWLGVVLVRKGWKERIYLGALSVLALILSWGVVTEGIKSFYPRPRPFVTFAIDALIEHGGLDSFPSAHMAFFGVLALAIYGANKNLGLWMLLGVVGIGFGRIMAGVHWPSDLVAGAGSAILSFYCVKFLLSRKGYNHNIRVAPQDGSGSN